ncbi:MAG TPA: MFS transporter [Candidatus Limnocylindrales bacterium]|nr:MFS transporter [Candidatus Limnocylindrales bacterium]
MAEARPTKPAELERLRRRTVASLVAGVALGSTGHIAAVTVATIVAKHISGGTTAWSGAPGATVVLGAAAGAVALSWVMVRRGRRFGLAAGYVVGVVGAFIATGSILVSSLPLLLIGTVLIGFGNASNQLSRYTAADLISPDRRASAIGVVVWGSTIGAVVGPNLVAPAGDIALAIGLPELAGPYLVPIVFVGAAALLSVLLLRPDPYVLADPSSRHDSAEAGAAVGSTATSVASVLARPNVPVAVVALVAGQFVMVLIMTMTPLHMFDHGHDLTSVGVVISGHTFGMYGLSPISGRLTDRFGSVPVILAGLAVVAFASVLAAAAPPDGGAVLFIALFLLGYGWNLGYVAGSALLTTGLSLAERTRVQGLTDGLIWSSAAVASLGSGVVLAYAGYAILGLLGAALVVVPILLVIARRSAVSGIA